MCPSDQTTDTTTSTDTASTTDASVTSTSDAPAASTTRTLEQAYEDYEKALADFESKLDLAVAAKTTAISAAQAVVTLKKELDAFEEDVTETFDKVQAYLASA